MDDHAGRPRTLEVFVTDNGKIGIFAPAPGVAVIPAEAAESVKQALTDAQVAVIQGRGTW